MIVVAIALSFSRHGVLMGLLAGLALFFFGISVPDNVRMVVASITLALVLFDNSRMRFAHLDTTAFKALRVSACSLILHAAALGWGLHIVGFDLFFSVIAGIALASVQSFSNELLGHESRFTSLLAIVIVFLLTSLRPLDAVSGISDIVIPWLTGIGTGVLIGIMVLRIIRHGNVHHRYLGFAFAAIVTYLLAAALNGSGVIAVIVLGMFVSNAIIAEHHRLDQGPFKSLLVLACLLLGMVSLTWQILLVALLLLCISVVIRFLVWFSVPMSFAERAHLALAGQRGADTAALLLLIGVIPLFAVIVPYLVAFLLGSQLLALASKTH